MAIATNALGSGALLEPSGFSYKQALSGSSLGFTFGFMVRIASSGMTDNGAYRLGLHDANADGGYTSGNETGLLISADTSARGATRARPALASSAGGGILSATATSPSYFTNAPQMVPGNNYLWLVGVRNTGTAGAPVWRIYWVGGQMGGTAVAQIIPEAASFASWLTGSNAFYSQFFSDVGSSVFRTPSGMAAENIAVMWHNIPWDTVNDHPDLSVVQAMLDGSATYESSSFLNGGTIKVWRKLSGPTDLADYGDDSRATATIRGTLVDASPIGSGLWLGASSVTINERSAGWVFGGRGTRTQTFSGTYDGAVTGLQFRIERNTGTIASPVWTLVSGYDWQTAGETIGSGVWSFSLPSTGLPVGANYRLRVRSATDSAVEAATTNRWHVGKVALLHGQSQMERAQNLGNGIRAPITNMAASVLRVTNSNQSAGSGAFEQPTIDLSDLTTSTATGGGIMALANAEWEATGEPTMYVDMTIEGSGLSQWINNDPYGNFFYRGDGTSLPTVSSANNSGVMTLLAIAAGRYRDVDLFNWGTSDTSDTAGWGTRMGTYRGLVNSYFSNSSASAPMIIFPYPRSCGGGAWPAPLTLRNIQRAYAISTANTVNGGDILDLVMDIDGGNHPRATITDVGSFTREMAGEGSQRMGLTMGRALARWATGGLVSLGAPVMASSTFTSGDRNVIDIECGITLSTTSGAALAQLFAVSIDSGSTFSESGFTASIVGTKIRLTKSTGNWTSATTRVDYCRQMPFQSTRENTEVEAITLLDGLVYGPSQAWRDGRGMHLQPLGGTGLAVGESLGSNTISSAIVISGAFSASQANPSATISAMIGLSGAFSGSQANPNATISGSILIAASIAAGVTNTSASIAGSIGISAALYGFSGAMVAAMVPSSRAVKSERASRSVTSGK